MAHGGPADRGMMMEHNATIIQFYAKAGDLLCTSQGCEGETPRRAYSVEFSHDKGWNRYDGKTWVNHLYTREEQARIDRERAACEHDFV